MHRLALFVAAFALVSPSIYALDGSTSQQLRRAAALSNKADKALGAGSVTRAAELFGKALTAAPAFPDAHLGMGHIAMREQRFEDALRAFEDARDGYGNMSIALQRAQFDRYDKAQRRISDLRVLISRLSQGSSNRGGESTNANNQARINEVRREIEQLQLIEPPRSEADVVEVPGEIYFYIGNALSRLNRIPEATEAWETCAERKPSFPYVYNNLAVVYLRANRVEDARASVERAEKLGVQVNVSLKADVEKATASRN